MKLVVSITVATVVGVLGAIPVHLLFDYLGVEGRLPDLAVLVVALLVGGLSDREFFYGVDPPETQVGNRRRFHL